MKHKFVAPSDMYVDSANTDGKDAGPPKSGNGMGGNRTERLEIRSHPCQ